MLAFLTVIIMLLLGYAYFVEGLFTAFVMCCNVVGAGLVAFNFFEPLASQVELGGYEDFLSLVLIFSLTLAILRTLTNTLANTEVEFIPHLQRPGGALFGMITGYLASGFILCAIQTLPWHENFMLFEPKYESGNTLRSILPPDRLWLAMMHRAGDAGFSRGDQTFDPSGSFELRYARYRRYNDSRDPLPYHGEFDPGIYRKTPKGQ
ncbi:MAG TPA: CvpA family protein [Gemmataceae bacterium]|jgi:hypothetical protein|nr:CvpA family protein [Gemmataceae bacterium]